MAGDVNFLEVYEEAHNSKDYNEAIEIFTSFIDDTNNNYNDKEKLPEAYYYRGLSYAQLGDIDNAIKDIQKADDLGFDKSKIYCARGIAYAHIGNNDAALKNFARANNQNYAEIYYRRGLAFYYKYNYKKAIKEFKNVIEKHEEYLKESYYYTGLSYAQQKSKDKNLNFNKAKDNFNKAEEHKFDEAKIYCGYGIAYAHVGNNKEAIENFDKAIELDKNYAEAYYRRGLAHYYRGKYENIANEYNEAYCNFEKAVEEGCYTYALFYHLYLLVSDKKISDKKYNHLVSKIIKKSISENLEYRTESLFNYTKINNNTLSSILESKIYLSHTDTFNDPVDPPIKILRDIAKNKKHFDKVIDSIRVACLTTSNDNILMWSHYGDKHQGMCIEYDISKLEKNEVILKHVNYYIKIQNKNNLLKNGRLNYKISFLDILALKEENWAYENEYRIIKYNKVQKDKNGTLIALPIKAIYLGTKTSKEDKELIKKLIDGKGIGLYKFHFDKKDIFKIFFVKI